jgi:hypothetical protein
MRKWRERGSSSQFCKTLSLAVFLVLSSTTRAPTQKQPGNVSSRPKYDIHTEAKIKGTVEEVKFLPTGAAKPYVHLVVKSENETIEVYLCPKAFLEEMGVTFSQRDEIQVIGSKVKQDGSDMILAREVVKGSDTVVLRDDKGNPVWNWKRK